MSLNRRLFSASALNLADYVLKIGVVLVVSPFLIGRLGKEEYGLWVLLLSVIGYLDLLDLGFNQTAVRYLSREIANADRQAIIFDHFRRLYRRIALLALGLTVVTLLVLPLFLQGPSLEKTRDVLGLGGLMVSGSYFLRVYSTLLKSHVLYHKLIIAGMVRLLVYTALMIAVLWRGGGLVELALAWVAGIVVELMMIGWQARSLVPRRTNSTERLTGLERDEINGFAAKTFGGVAASFMRERVDTQVLAGSLGNVAVTHYAVGARLISMFTDVVNALFGGHFLAAFAQLHAESGPGVATRLLLTTLRMSAPLALAGGITIFLLGPAFIDCWLGGGFEESHQVIRILAFPVALVLMQYPVGPYLGSMNRHGILATISLVGGGLNLVGSLLLVRWVGFEGVVIATAAELLLTGLVMWPWMLGRAGDVPPRQYYAVLLRPVLVLLPVALLGGWFLVQYGQPQSFPQLLFQASLLLGIMIGLAWLWLFRSEEKRWLLARLWKAPPQS
jgi:O-antigen/teichoic acid export membrane protein